MVTAPERDLVAPPTEQEVDLIKRFENVLTADAPQHPRLVAPNGETMEIPEPIYEVLRHIVPLMAQGAAIGLVPLHRELTTQQAADLLNISRPTLIKLLDAGEIPYRKMEGGHRRVRCVDVLAYKQQRSAARHAAFVKMAAMGQKHGAYEPDDDPLFGIDLDETNDEHN